MAVKEHREEMIALREAGKTYREIGESFGVSLQYVYKLLSETRSRETSMRMRKSDVDIEKIAYEGIYNLFVSDYKMTVTRFARIALGVKGHVGETQRERIRRFIYNYNDAKVSVSNIRNICRYIGEPFELVFAVRKKTEREGTWVVTENGCVITCSECGYRLELCYPDGTEVRWLPGCPNCRTKMRTE